MALEIDVPNLENEVLNNTQITHNNTFIFPVGQDITTGDLVSLIDYHRLHIRPQYLKNRKYYEGDHDIMHKASKAPYKPDNRLVVNFPRKAVTSFNGFFIGTPVKIDSKDKSADEYISTWTNINNFEDVNSEVSKEASMYGRAYYFVYQDEQGNPCVVPSSPLDTFLIYDDTIARNVKYGVHYSYNVKGELMVSLMSVGQDREFVMNGKSDNYLDQVGVYALPYPIVPIIEAVENEERLSLCHDIVTLIDALDKAMSEKANDVDYFADAYMKIINAYLPEEEVKKFNQHLRDERMVVVNGADNGAEADTQVDFMEKPSADETQEHLVDRLVDYIYQIANVVNLNDEAFAGNPAGVTLKLKYQPMKDMADVKANKFKKSLRDVFRCVFSVVPGMNPDVWQDLTFRFTQSTPQNLLELAQAYSYFYGKISTKLLLQQMPFVDDPDEAMAEFKKENQDTQQQTGGMVQQILGNMTDQQKQKGGVGNAANTQSGKATDSATNQLGRPNGPTE